MKINQLLPGFGSGDAISNYALQLQAILRRWGHESEIYCESRHVGPTEEHLCRDHRLCPAPGDPLDVTIYHYSIGSELTDFFRRLEGRKVLIYHNITPHVWFQGIHDEKARSLWNGREELKRLAAVPDLALGVSEFNRRELEAFGFARTAVLPLIVDGEKLSREPDAGLLKRYGDGAANILFTGRIAPNKRVEDLIKIFYYYRTTLNANSRLLLAGSLIGMDRYTSHLRALITLLDLPDVTFFNHVTDAELYSLYRTAGVFLCMSEHEGFCIPLLEAIYFRVPVLAYAAAAIPETLAGTGVLVREKNHAAIAELIDRILGDPALRAAIVAKQAPRVAAFSTEAVAGRLKELLSQL
ncbi:MAG: glycosyltransferase family 4 protein [Candidatus Aureabacteria bacterium]|nr:glycosyltransferase family 4 protein [Candidatus Auribacterota bacterium]